MLNTILLQFLLHACQKMKTQKLEPQVEEINLYIYVTLFVSTLICANKPKDFFSEWCKFLYIYFKSCAHLQ